jgi:hypothetical protein
MSFRYEFIKVFRLQGGERGQPEVVNDQKVRVQV